MSGNKRHEFNYMLAAAGLLLARWRRAPMRGAGADDGGGQRRGGPLGDLIGIDKLSNLLFPLHQGNRVIQAFVVCPIQFVSVKQQSAEPCAGGRGERRAKAPSPSGLGLGYNSSTV